MHGVVEYDISSITGSLVNAFIIMINALFFNVKFIGLTDIYPTDYSQGLLNEEETVFDFIIVGAGSSGCTLANILSKQEQWSVLLIEAGDYPSSTTEVPGLFTTLIGTKEDWHFLMEKNDKACKGTISEQCFITGGRVLGGTSTINNMLYVRGLLEDYDVLGIEMWNANVTRYAFEALEGYVGEDCPTCHYGQHGSFHFEMLNHSSTSRQILSEAYKSAGYTSMHKRHALGQVDQLLTVKNGERFNAAKAFLTPIKHRPNLFFTKNTEVEAISITEPVDKRANGVNVSIDGIKMFLKARKEVILTAGPINNAKLLLVSGVGPYKYLTEKNIKPNSDLIGVGKNLMLHLTVPIFISIEPPSVCQKEYYRESDFIQDTFEYVMHRRGNLSHIGVGNFVVYINSKKGSTIPNLSIHHMYFKIEDRNLLAWLDSRNYHPRIADSLLNYNKQRSLLLFLITLISPLSRGEVLLNNTHHLSNPIIKGNFFSDEDNLDLHTLLYGVGFVTNLTDHIKGYEATFLNLDIPKCRNHKFCTKKYVQCYINNMAFPINDVVGTVRMGAECEAGTVVRENLEVKNVRCLRVADSSILPVMTLGSTKGTNAMIGFRMGEILKEKWIKDYVSPFK